MLVSELSSQHWPRAARKNFRSRLSNGHAQSFLAEHGGFPEASEIPGRSLLCDCWKEGTRRECEKVGTQIHVFGLVVEAFTASLPNKRSTGQSVVMGSLASEVASMAKCLQLVVRGQSIAV